MFESRAPLIAALVSGMLLFGLGFLPQLGGLGYEHAVISGVILPSACAIATALEISAKAGAPFDGARRGAWNGVRFALLGIAVGLVHGLRVGICDLWGGLLTFALTAGFGSIMGGLWGWFAGERAMHRRRRRFAAVTIALLGPLGGVAISLWRFYSSPMVFAYDPFFGFFNGTLYDTVTDAGTPLLTYRLGSFATVLAVLTLASAARRTPGNGVRLERKVSRVALGAAFALASVVITLSGPALGHWETPETIARELGGARAGERCDVVFPKTLRDEESALLAKDCDEEIESAERVLGTHEDNRIRAFFFRDSAEKRRLMGAADTYIAKPWRREVYLQLGSYPHPVLGHEIAHAVAGSFGRGPFHIAGEAGGWWPNPGLIEGVAVAASPDEDELTDLEWAAAMKRKDKLPPMSQIFSVDFLGGSASKSYTLAGAFVRWLLDTRGSGVLRDWYAGGSLDALVGKSWTAIDAEFREALDKVTLPPAAVAYVDSKFERPSVWARPCPHVVDALKHGGDVCRDSHDLTGARAAYGKALVRDGHDWAVSFSLATMELKEGDVSRGKAMLESIATDAPLAYAHKAREALADRAWQDGQFDAAAAIYADLAEHTPDEDQARTLQVKSIAVKSPDARDAVRALLVGDSNRGPDVALASARLGAWEERTGDPLASYLLGKSTSQRNDPTNAAVFLDRALAHLDALPPRVGREAIRQRAVAACALGDAKEIIEVRRLLTAPSNPFTSGAGGRLEATSKLMDRCHAH